MKKNILVIICALFSTMAVIAAGPSDRLGSSALAPSGIPTPQAVTPGTDVVVDGGFELGTPNAAWTVESSSTFGTPVCDLGGCGAGGGTGPHSGNFWTWFGGIGAVETGDMGQSVTIPVGTATLEFWLEVNACDSAADFMDASIDGTVVFHVQGDDAVCGVVGYVLHTVDVSAFADGGSHDLLFHSEIFANNGGGSNFFLDDVALVFTAPPMPIPGLQWYGLALLALILLTLGYRRNKA